VELVVAVAAERVEDVAGEALGVDADDGGGFKFRRARVEIAEGEGDGGFDGFSCGIAGDGEGFEAEDAEVSPTGGEVRIGDLGDAGERHSFIIDSVAGGRIHWGRKRAYPRG